MNIPNVIIVIMDDLCYGDLACHGNPHTRTPNLDKMHSNSVRMTRYCSGPLCSPARASLMTGRYHMRTKVVDTYLGRSMLDHDEITLAHLMKDKGYRTGAFGKWHLGDCYPMRAMDMGFEETLMHFGGGIGQPGDHPHNYNRPEECYFDPVLYRNGKEEFSQGYCTDIFTEETMKFAESHKDEPFFAYLATNAPHTPLIIGDEWADTYRNMGINDTHSRLYGMVENIDYNIGRLRNKLEELGIAEDTIIIYTSDHGPCSSARDQTAKSPEKKDRFNCGLRGIKGSMYEGGVRVPHFWEWPAKIQEGRDIDTISSPIDILPTLAEACDLSLPDCTIDGENLMPLFEKEISEENWPERNIYMQWHRGNTPVEFRNFAVISQKYKYTKPSESQQDELYNLLEDPTESNNIASAKPEITSQLKADYANWYHDVSTTRENNYSAPKIITGTKFENPTILTRQDWRIHGPDGWSDNHYGHWELQLDNEAQFDIEILINNAPSVAGTVHLKFEKNLFELPTIQDTKSYHFTNIKLPKGSYNLESWIDTANTFTPPLTVTLKRK